MAANYGVNVITSVKSSRPIAIDSTTPIGIVGYGGDLETGLHFYGSISAALDALGYDEGGRLSTRERLSPRSWIWTQPTSIRRFFFRS
jgi:hypothetical protein